MIKRNLRSRISDKNSNKKLYESIMKDVAKTVKKHLNESSLDSIYELFDEYETDNISVGAFDIIKQGCLITNIIYDEETDSISIWAGDPETDKYAEELLLSNAERREVFEEILEYM